MKLGEDIHTHTNEITLSLLALLLYFFLPFFDFSILHVYESRREHLSNYEVQEKATAEERTSARLGTNPVDI